MGVKLMVEQTNSAASTIPVRWCVDKETLEQLVKEKVSDPHLLLVAWNKRSGRERRWLVPLDQLMEYVSFSGPGENRLFAFIIWTRDGKRGRRKLRSHYFRFLQGSYDFSVLDFSGRPWGYWLEGEYGLMQGIDPTPRESWERITSFYGRLVIEVDAAFFAAEPPRWMKRTVNFVFRERSDDQCDFRRQFALACLALPFLAVFGATAFVVTLMGSLASVAILALIGTRGIHWRADFGSTPARYVRYAREDNRVRFCWGHMLLWPAAPLAPLILGMLYWAVHRHISLGVYIQTVGIAICYLWGMTLVTFLSENGFKWIAKKASKQRGATRAPAPSKNPAFLSVSSILACNGPKVLSVRALPQKQQTFHLRFQAFKAKVCKPFAQ